MTHSLPRLSAKPSEQKRLAPYAWLAAGVLVMGGAALAEGSGTAHADNQTSTSNSTRSAGPARPSSAGTTDKRPGAAASSAVTASVRTGESAPAPGLRRARGTSAPSTETYGSAAFSYTGASQTWQVPTGVQSAYVQVQGGFGGPCVGLDCGANYSTPAWQYPANVTATVTLSGQNTPAISALNLVVGGGGGSTAGKEGGAGGYNGGGAGGSGSDSGNGGAGGGGATTVYVVTGGSQDPEPILVAGGGGGNGGQNVADDNKGGLGGSAITSAGPGSEWPGNDGQAGEGRDGGSGGAGGVIPDGTGQAGGDAETLSGNSGGGGGGGGYYGGAGGEPGQADVVSYFTGSGGGGGGGSSYASPLITSNAYAGPAPQPADPSNPANLNGSAVVQWVDILSTALTPLTVGQNTSQQLQAYYAGSPSVTWQVSGGTLPAGLTLSPSGLLSGTPTTAGQYSYQATVSPTGTPLITSVVDYSGSVTGPARKTFWQRIVGLWQRFFPRPLPR